MDIKSEAENLMPGSLTRWIWWSSIGLSAILYKFYPDLPKSWLPQTEEVYFLTRLLLSGSALLLGSLSLVILLSRHDKKMRLQNAELKGALDAVSTDAQGYSKSNKTLQSLLASNAEELETLKKSHAALIEQNENNFAQIDMLSNADDGLREELNRMAAHHNDSSKEIVKLQDDYKTLQQQYSESERLCNERKFLLDVAEKKIAELSKPIEAASASSAPGPDDYHAPRRSFFQSDNDRPKRR